MLWEFCSAIVPQLLGGGFAFAIILLNGERIKLGKSIAVVLFSSFLDGLFFALIAPIVYFWFGKEQLFSNINANSTQKLAMGDTLMYTFWTIYFIVLIYKLIVAYVLFFNARRIKQIAYKLFSFPFLKKWKRNVVETMQEMEIASIELKSATIGYWIKSFAATLLSWSARFILINCIISAFNTIPFDHFLLYARQSIMGILNIGTPTPGGAGFAEFMFTNFLGEFISNASLTVTLAFVWRLFSYYPYLIVGAIVLPRWIAISTPLPFAPICHALPPSCPLTPLPCVWIPSGASWGILALVRYATATHSSTVPTVSRSDRASAISLAVPALVSHPGRRATPSQVASSAMLAA